MTDQHELRISPSATHYIILQPDRGDICDDYCKPVNNLTRMRTFRIHTPTVREKFL
jgi:hypothetical protein